MDAWLFGRVFFKGHGGAEDKCAKSIGALATQAIHLKEGQSLTGDESA